MYRSKLTLRAFRESNGLFCNPLPCTHTYYEPGTKCVRLGVGGINNRNFLSSPRWLNVSGWKLRHPDGYQDGLFSILFHGA